MEQALNLNKMKARANLGLSKLSIPAKIEKARHMVTAMTGNSSFTTPVPALASVTTAINTLETAYNAAQGAGPLQTATMRDKEAILDNLLSQLVNYVEVAANGVEAVILSAGIDVKSKGGRSAATFTADDGEHSGEVVLHTRSAGAARASYIWQVAPDPLPNELTTPSATSTWQQLGVSVRASFVANNLVAGVKYWFRVAVVGKNGQSTWSDPISKVVSA
jgi:hypothetical protein